MERELQEYREAKTPGEYAKTGRKYKTITDEQRVYIFVDGRFGEAQMAFRGLAGDVVCEGDEHDLHGDLKDLGV